MPSNPSTEARSSAEMSDCDNNVVAVLTTVPSAVPISLIPEATAPVLASVVLSVLMTMTSAD